tara:strand:- start:675 stop:1007 length:333 start_codon:yes stop_codon:yes gene_type:complete
MKKKTTKAKKPAVKKVAPKKKAPAKKKIVKEKLVGKVSHYFDKIKVAAIKINSSVKKGDTLRIEGGTIVAKVKITSMQKDHKSVAAAKAKDEIGIKVSKRVREGYRVFKV